jgi:hypothetical protein
MMMYVKAEESSVLSYTALDASECGNTHPGFFK